MGRLRTGRPLENKTRSGCKEEGWFSKLAIGDGADDRDGVMTVAQIIELL